MPDKAWKLRERQAAAFFGCRRTVGSGSLGRDDRTRSDSTHPRLFIECKLKKVHATRTLHDRTAALARKENKVPVLMLADGDRAGFLVCVHTQNFDKLVAERVAQVLAANPHLEVDELISTLRSTTPCVTGKDRSA